VSPSPYAGLASRLIALFLDSLVVTVLVLAVGTLPQLLWKDLLPEPVPSWLADVDSLTAAAIPLVYFTLLWTMTGQTLGALAIGVRVTNVDGRRLSLKHSFVRALVGLALGPLWLVGMLAIVVDRRRRAWHDRLLRSEVRYTRPRR
jgi:uncharacterized RDD family membrane protein YckC